MAHKRNELVPIGDALSGMSGPIQAFREAEPPARRGFTVADQVDRLVSASEANPDMGFMARTMALCSLPRSNPGNRKEYKRVNGPFTLYMVPHRSQLLRVVDFECQVDDPIDLALLRRTWLALDLERNRWIGRGNRHEGEK